MIQLAQEKAEDRGRRTEIREQTSEIGQIAQSSVIGHPSSAICPPTLSVALLTGGDDRPYVLGLVSALTSKGITCDVIGSDDLELPELLNDSRVDFLNLRGDQRSDANLVSKVARVLRYYARLIAYTARARPQIFHILWNNKFELFDRTLLILYYKFARKTVVFTAHNVNSRKRDGTDSWLNRLSLRIQYRLVDHILVHSSRMKDELVTDFRIRREKVTIIPFGINNTVPNTDLSPAEAKRILEISTTDKVLLCYGQIAPYKGLEYLAGAFAQLLKADATYRLIIAGKPKWNNAYWKNIQQSIDELGCGGRVITRIEHVPDEETELYFKAADVLILSYKQIFQSGVIFLGYSFGLPAIVADVGSLPAEVDEGKTGFVFKAQESSDLADKINLYFSSDLFRNLESRRHSIKEYANERYSWDKVAVITTALYSRLLANL